MKTEISGVQLQDKFKSYFINSTDFNLFTTNSSKVSTKFELLSTEIKTRFYVSNRASNIFSFITNKNHLLFYFRINPQEFITDSIRVYFKDKLNPSNSKGEITIKLKTFEDIESLFNLLFVKHLNLVNTNLEKTVYNDEVGNEIEYSEGK